MSLRSKAALALRERKALTAARQSKLKRHYFPRFEELETRVLLTAPAAPLVVGPDAGGTPRVKVYDAETGQLKMNFLAFEQSFTGGVRVATGDVTGDGVPDIIAAKGPGGGSQVRVFDGATGNQIANFNAFAGGVTDGVYFAGVDMAVISRVQMKRASHRRSYVAQSR